MPIACMLQYAVVCTISYSYFVDGVMVSIYSIRTPKHLCHTSDTGKSTCEVCICMFLLPCIFTNLFLNSDIHL